METGLSPEQFVKSKCLEGGWKDLTIVAGWGQAEETSFENAGLRGSVIHPFFDLTKYFMSIYYATGTVPDIRDTAVTKIVGTWLHGVDPLGRRRRINT